MFPVLRLSYREAARALNIAHMKVLCSFFSTASNTLARHEKSFAEQF
jgi:hypothetical protein